MVKYHFPESGATSKNVNWVSLILPNDAEIIQSYLDEFKEKKYIPESLKSLKQIMDYFDSRYTSSSDWIKKNNHAVISNGPFYLKEYSPEARTITVKAFEDKTYPFKVGYWSNFEKTEFPNITNVELPDSIQKGNDLEINIETSHTNSILYFLIGGNGELASSESIKWKKIPPVLKSQEK